MADVDPDTLLEWLQMGQGDERDMQLIALEQLCMLLLMSDNVDRCFETCPPRTFLPALCKIFLDESAPDNVLEVTARAITYYLDVSAECTRRIVGVDGAIKALCNRLVVVELNNRTSRDLAEQCVKVLELICTRESGAVFEAGGLNCVLTFIRDSGHLVHKDTLHSAMAVVSRLCGKMEPQDSSLEICVESLSSLLKHEDHQDSTMAATVNLELDPIFLKALGFLHSKSKDSAEKLKALLDESLARGTDSSYRPSQKEVEQPKVSVTKPISSKQEPKASSSLPSGSNNGKPTASEKVKKETEKRSDKMKGDTAEGADTTKKARVEKQEARSSPITVQTSKDLSMPDLSSFEETSADDFAMEMGLACVVCRQMTVISGNQLVECQECHNLYHQDCHKPQVTDKEVNDPRLVWYCARCTRQMKRMAQKTQKPPQKTAPAVVSVVPAVKDPLVKKPEIKLKPETPPTFLAFKRTEVKTSAAISGNSASTSVSSSATSGLTGWAAFAAKTSSANPSTAKLGSAAQNASGKPAASSNNQKPVGLSGLATSKTGLGSKIASANNSTNPVQLKPPPPLTLGKTTLSRSVSSDNVSKVGLPSPSSAAPSTSSQVSSGNGNSGTVGSSGGSASKTTSDTGNQSASLKGPTSQESQLNAMKRLQMVKKKAAQKKLKK